MIHKCNKEKEITEIRTNIATLTQKIIGIEKKFFGNGVKGMIQDMREVLEWINIKKGEEIAKKGIDSLSRKTIMILISIVIPLITVIFSFALHKIFGG